MHRCTEIKIVIDKYKLSWDKIVEFTSDGAAAMIGKQNGVVVNLRNIVKEEKFQNNSSFYS